MVREMTDRVSGYVAVDVETTGLDPKLEKIIEIGAVKVEGGRVTEEKTTLVNPRRELSQRIMELTGISGDMVANAPGIEEVIGEYEEFCRGYPLVGHKILFDYSFLKRAAVNHGFPFEKEGVDTLTLCRKFMPPDVKKNLTSACAYYGVNQEKAHRALGDACSAHRLFEELKKRHILENIEVFYPKPLIYKIKREQPATKRQKEVLQELLKYHKINLTVQIDYMTRNEVSRIMDKIISQYGRIAKR